MWIIQWFHFRHNMWHDYVIVTDFLCSQLFKYHNYSIEFSHDVYPKSFFLQDDIDNESMERDKVVIISLIRSYMPNDWLWALVRASFHIFKIVNTLLVKISKNYIIYSSNERHDKLRRKKSPPVRCKLLSNK